MDDKDATIADLVARAETLVRRLDVTVEGMQRKLQGGG